MDPKRETPGPLMGEDCIEPAPGAKTFVIPFNADRNACLCLNMGLRLLPRRVTKLYFTNDPTLEVMSAEE